MNADLQLRQALDADASPWLQYASFSVKPPDAAPPAQRGKLAPVSHHRHIKYQVWTRTCGQEPHSDGHHHFTWCWNSVWLSVRLTLPSALSAASSRSRSVALSTSK